MYNIFLSYAHAQVASAINLQARLAMPNVSVFVAERDLPAGESLSSVISAQIKNSDLFVLLWTIDASESRYVSNEVFVAKTENKKILPLIIDHGVPLPPILGDVKYLDITAAPDVHLSWLKDFILREAQGKATSQAVGLAVLGFLAIAALGGKK